jgi:hypothetical protein
LKARLEEGRKKRREKQINAGTKKIFFKVLLRNQGERLNCGLWERLFPVTVSHRKSPVVNPGLALRH